MILSKVSPSTFLFLIKRSSLPENFWKLVKFISLQLKSSNFWTWYIPNIPFSILSIILVSWVLHIFSLAILINIFLSYGMVLCCRFHFLALCWRWIEKSTIFTWCPATWINTLVNFYSWYVYSFRFFMYRLMSDISSKNSTFFFHSNACPFFFLMFLVPYCTN